jgi:cytochrome c-type biogenesis protein CcmH/NrfG
MRLTFRSPTVAIFLCFVTFAAYGKTASEVYEQAAKSTVVVLNIDNNGKNHSMGSGVVFSDGYVVTNCHVIKGASSIAIRIEDKEFPATLKYSDWDRDICSLSIANLRSSPIFLGNTKTLKVGAKVYAIGAPKGLELTLSDGIVSSLREVDGGRYIQTTAAISPGSSGGGLFDENGALVGLTTFYLAEGQNLNFAVPVEWVNELPKRSTKTDTVTKPVTQWMNESGELQKKDDWSRVLEHSIRWTKAQPNHGYAWIVLGVAYNRLGQPAKGIESYKQALRINPRDADAWFHMGIDYIDDGQLTQAMEAYEKSVRFNPEFSDAWKNLGIAYRKAGHLTKAIKAYQECLRLKPEDVEAWTNLGGAYALGNQFAKSMEAYQQALRINPKFAKAWFGLGITYAAMGERGKAIMVYEQLKILDPAIAEQLSKLIATL